MSRRLIDAETD